MWLSAVKEFFGQERIDVVEVTVLPRREVREALARRVNAIADETIERINTDGSGPYPIIPRNFRGDASF
jgi:hypothetical protein